ncbi:hypothetical protein GCM10025773_11920 [Microbacterium jejuense]
MVCSVIPLAADVVAADMKRTYRIVRGALAVTALLGLSLFTAWHVLLWRMGETYTGEGGTPLNHWTGSSKTR